MDDQVEVQEEVILELILKMIFEILVYSVLGKSWVFYVSLVQFIIVKIFFLNCEKWYKIFLNNLIAVNI